jgi:tRNA dimethylallyltransferase
MDVGTAKPSEDELARIPHHLIDIREPDQEFTAGDFVRAAKAAVEDIHERGKRALIVGGTGFYLKALLYGLWEGPPADEALREEIEKVDSQKLYDDLYAVDPESALRIGVNDRYRLVRAHEVIRLTGKTPSALQSQQPKTPDPQFSLWVVDRPAEELNRRIDLRARAMLAAGLVDEVKGLRARYPAARSLGAVGYAQVCLYLDGAKPEGRKPQPGLEGLESEIVLATRQLVKRQRTWFRADKSAQWFLLEQDRAELVAAFEELYS